MTERLYESVLLQEAHEEPEITQTDDFTSTYVWNY